MRSANTACIGCQAAVIARTDASILFTAKRFGEAEARLSRAVDDFPDDPDLRYDY
ncbi:hypothetical protein G3N57_34385, partial [Paraburkholderia sp. Se-20369]|nr:hypothetical protein [Paraburkholderia sp. Se-20369]